MGGYIEWGCKRFRFWKGSPRREVRMAVTTFMTMLCLAGVAFCVRFLVGLGKEYKARSPSRLAGAAYPPNQEATPQPRERKHPVDRPAREPIGRGPLSDSSCT